MRGSVSQRIKGGGWEIKFDLPRGEDGKRRQRTRTYPTKRLAERELARIQCEIAAGTYVDEREKKRSTASEDTLPAVDLTLTGQLNRWLRTVQNSVRVSTYQRYEEIVKKHLIPKLGNVPLSDLTTPMIIDWQEAQLHHGRSRQGGVRGSGLSRQTVKHHVRVLRQALKKAVEWDLITKNPADAVVLPKPSRNEMVALTEEEVKLLFAAAEGTTIYPMIVLLTLTGIRRGELLGLRWDDIDWDEKRLRISRSLTVVFGSALEINDPKTPRSRRSVPLADFALTVLCRQRSQQAAMRLQMGPAFKDQGLIFCSADGSFFSPIALSHRFCRLIEASGLRKCRLHDLRHTFASLMLQEGRDMKLVSTMLGHASVVITLDRYSHLMPGHDAGVAETMDRLFGTG